MYPGRRLAATRSPRRGARRDRSRAPLAAAIFVAAIAAVTFKFASLPVAVLGGAFLMLLTRCLSPEEAYRQVEWKALILIGALLSRGKARGVGFAGLVSVGNEVDLSLGDICATTLDDPGIDGYMLFLETMRHA